MGVHHAWGRTYKDLYSASRPCAATSSATRTASTARACGSRSRSRRSSASSPSATSRRSASAEFVERARSACGASPRIQTEQSIRLGYWMDWDNSLLHDVGREQLHDLGVPQEVLRARLDLQGPRRDALVPALRHRHLEHEIVTEGYQEITHEVYLRSRVTSTLRAALTIERELGPAESLLVWTTTPWTLAGNVAAAVNPELTYVKVRQGDERALRLEGRARRRRCSGEHEVAGRGQGQRAGRAGPTTAPFDELPAQAGVDAPRHRLGRSQRDRGHRHRAHRARAAARRTSRSRKEHGLAVIAPLDEDGTYLARPASGRSTGKFAGDVPHDGLRQPAREGRALRVAGVHAPLPALLALQHRAGLPPGRRVVHQHGRAARARSWTIDAAADHAGCRSSAWRASSTGCSNMDDWMISKKRYWGLALPIYECAACGDVRGHRLARSS